MSVMYLLVGNIGLGKSLIARKLAWRGCVVVNHDALQVTMDGGEYGWYDSDKRNVYHACEDGIIRAALLNGMDVVIDRTLISKRVRSRFIELAVEYKAEVICYDFGRGDSEGLERRLKEPRGMSVSTWNGVYDRMKGQYESPVSSEGIQEVCVPPSCYVSHKFDFDGTLVINAFPDIGKLITEGVAWELDQMDCVLRIRTLWEDFSNIIIIESNRSGNYEMQMREFLIRERIPYDAINENPVFDTGSRKVFATYNYDDRNVPIYRNPDAVFEKPRITTVSSIET